MKNATTNTKAVAKVSAQKEVKTMKKANADKQNQTFTLKVVNDLMAKNNIIPKYSDSQNYVGCGVKSNTFSVNVKKSQFNIFCDSVAFEQCSKVKGVEAIKDGNSADKVRPHKIIAKSIEELEALIKVVATNKLAKLIVND